LLIFKGVGCKLQENKKEEKEEKLISDDLVNEFERMCRSFCFRV
jgi:hypothetical protein